MKELQKFAYPVFFVVMAVLPHMLDDRWQAVAITFLIFAVVALRGGSLSRYYPW